MIENNERTINDFNHAMKKEKRKFLKNSNCLNIGICSDADSNKAIEP